MRNSVKFIVLGLAAAGLSACGGMELGKARSVDPKGSAFDVNLYTEYLALSGAEFDEADYKDSDTFAMRAIAAGGGAATTPEEVKARNIPLNAVPDLTAAHDSLVDALGKGAKEKAPMDAARAQAMYECWMQEQEENFQPNDIAACRAGFEAAMAKGQGGDGSGDGRQAGPGAQADAGQAAGTAVPSWCSSISTAPPCRPAAKRSFPMPLPR